MLLPLVASLCLHFSAGPAVAKNGMVATSQPVAVEAGLKILQAGGNAIDAAIAANATLGVVEPMSCGLGGDLFAIVWDAKSKKLYGLNASGRSPYAATRAFFAAKGLKQIPEYGPLSWSVPGCADGWKQLLSRFGSLPLSKVLEPAVEAAEKGFVVTPVIGRGWRNSERTLRRDADAAATYMLASGRAPAPGERIANPRLAATLRRLGTVGTDDFYKGEIAAKLVAVSEKKGGLFSPRDLADHTSSWVEPISTTYRGYSVWELPPNGQGLAVLEMLNLLEAYDIRKMAPDSPEFAHLFVEAKKLAYADRAAFYADPEVERNLPIAALASKPYAEAQRKRIDLKRAAKEVAAGEVGYAHADTIYLTVVDKDRNCVSFIQSIYNGWGSGVCAGDLGFMIQDRGCLFALDDKHPNRLEPHKRPFHTIIPAMVTKDGTPWLTFGVMGGDMQPQGQVQVLLNMIDHGMDPQAAGAALRIRHDGSSSPTGQVMHDGGKVILERSAPESLAEALKAKGHTVTRGPSSGMGGYQAIRIDAAGTLTGGSDPRKDGLAKGY